MIARLEGTISAAPSPWRARSTISKSGVGASAHAIEAAVGADQQGRLRGHNAFIAYHDHTIPLSFTWNLDPADTPGTVYITHGEENGRSRWPEEYDTLARLPWGLEETLQWGMFGFLARPLLWLLLWIHDNVVANYGWAIIAAIRLVLYGCCPERMQILPFHFGSASCS